jgi:hypothetical protein
MSIEVIKIPFESSRKGKFIKQGDTIPAIIFKTTNSELAWWTYTGAYIHFVLKKGSQAVFEVDSDTIGGITIDSDTQFTIDSVPANENNLPKGCLDGDITITFSNGNVKTISNVQYQIIEKY